MNFPLDCEWGRGTPCLALPTAMVLRLREDAVGESALDRPGSTSIFAKPGVENRSRAIVLAREAGFGQKAP